MAIVRKYERDIDILLAEEFTVSPEFADCFRRGTKFAGIPASVVDVFVSKSDVTGESDLEVVYAKSDGDGHFAILIENKIDAPFQPDQAARYRLRAEAGVQRGRFADFEVVLCSPVAYRDAQPDTAPLFDRFLSYEEIGGFISKADPSPRGQFRAGFIGSATCRRSNTWQRVDDTATNLFWNAAYRIAATQFPILEMKEVAMTKDSTWLDLRPGDFPTRPTHTCVKIKGDRGYIDLTFANTLLNVFLPLAQGLLNDDMTMHQTGKSVAIRIAADGFRIPDGPERNLPKIRAAFAASERLVRFYREHRTVLDEAARAATPA